MIASIKREARQRITKKSNQYISYHCPRNQFLKLNNKKYLLYIKGGDFSWKGGGITPKIVINPYGPIGSFTVKEIHINSALS